MVFEKGGGCMKRRLSRVVIVCLAAILATPAGVPAADAPRSLQQRIDEARPGDTLAIPPGSYAGPIVVKKPLKLIGSGLPLIQGTGKVKVVRIESDDVTLSGFRIAGSGLSLFNDDAAVYVTGNNITLQGNEISESLHGIYLKKVTNCRVIGNSIRGKT